MAFGTLGPSEHLQMRHHVTCDVLCSVGSVPRAVELGFDICVDKCVHIPTLHELQSPRY